MPSRGPTSPLAGSRARSGRRLDTFSVAWDASGLAAGTYRGLVAIGTAEAPGVLRVPLEVTVP